MKLNFPKYDGTSDTLVWFCSWERFFSVHRVQPRFQVPFTSYYLAGVAQIWFGMLKSEPPSWVELKQSMIVEYGPSQFDDFFGGVIRLQQTGAVKEYQKQFSRLLARAGSMNDSQKSVAMFVG